MNGAWGYDITAHNYKSVKRVIQYLAGAAGRDANLLLNVGPMPSGAVQPEFTDTLIAAGKWLQQYGESIYGTRGGPLLPRPWGVTTQKGNRIYIHLFSLPEENSIVIPLTNRKIKQVKLPGSNAPVKYKQQKDGIVILSEGLILNGPDTIILIELQ